MLLKKIGKSNKKYNQYELLDEYGIGYTSKKEEFYFDLEDYEKIKDYCWYLDKDGYVVNKSTDAGIIRMHRLVLNVSQELIVDHINHNTGDNRKCNLRICTIKDNNKNLSIKSSNTTGITGLVYDTKYDMWRVSITVDYQTIYLGSYNNKNDAIKARKEAEEKYFGEYSYSNSIELSKEYEFKGEVY